MSPQIQTVEVSTNIPSKLFITADITKKIRSYSQTGCIDGPQTKTPVSTSEPDDKLSSWIEIVHLHLTALFPIPVTDVLDPYTIDETLQIQKVDTSTNRLENFVAEKLFTIPEVEYVFLSLENNLINIWTTINILNREVRKKIYDIEYDILDLFKDFRFDFHVISRNNRNINELHPSKAKTIFHR